MNRPILFVLLWALIFCPDIASAVVARVTDDAFTSSTQPNTNFGTNAGLNVTATRNTYVRFNVDTLPVGTTAADVVKATVTIFTNTVATAGALDVYAVAGPWEESTITANTAPALGSVIALGTPITENRSFVSIEITALVQAWVTTPADNHGIVLRPNVAGVSVVFDSKENTAGAHEPVLDITLRPATNNSVRVSKAAPQSIPHTTAGGPDAFTAVTFSSERWDTNAMYNNSVSSSCLTVTTAGTYYIWGNVEWATNPTGVRLLGIKLDGNINIAQVSQNAVADPSLGTAQSVSTLYQLSAGQCVELVVRQTSGGLLDIVYNPIYSLEFGMVRVP